jgi:chromosome partitioning protein
MIRRAVMSYIIAFANQKGGVGKTTSAVNIAACLGVFGKRALIVDLDPQGNATSAVGINKREVRQSVYDVVIGQASAAQATIKTPWEGLWIIPSTISLAGAEIDLIEIEHRERSLKNALDAVADQYDVIIIDCPPSLGLLTVNALTAANGVVIPMQCEYFALEGLTLSCCRSKR